MQAIDALVADALQAGEAAPADARGMLVVVARQVVGLEDHLERLDVGQRQVVQRHVADQLPQVVALQRRCIAGGHRVDVAETEEFGGVLAGQADIAGLELARQVLVGAGQLDGQRFMLVVIAQAEAQPGVLAFAEQRGLLAHAVVRPRHRHVEAGIVLEGFERHVVLVAHAAGLPAGHPVHREHPALLAVVFGRQQQVLVLLAVQADRDGVVREQVDHRRAVQPYVVQRRADALHAGLLDVEPQLQAPGLLELLRRQALQDVQALELDEQELVGEDEIFLQVAVAAEGIERVGNQRLVLGEAHRFELCGGQRQRLQRFVVRAAQWFALGVQHDYFDAAEMAQQAEVEQLADIRLAGQVQAQALQPHLAEMPFGAHLQVQAEQRAVALDRVVQRLQRQR